MATLGNRRIIGGVQFLLPKGEQAEELFPFPGSTEHIRIQVIFTEDIEEGKVMWDGLGDGSRIRINPKGPLPGFIRGKIGERNGQKIEFIGLAFCVDDIASITLQLTLEGGGNA
jgi:hypothetical protein